MYREPRDRIDLLFQMIQEIQSDLDIIKNDLKKLKTGKTDIEESIDHMLWNLNISAKEDDNEETD